MREILGLDSLIGPNQVAKMFFFVWSSLDDALSRDNLC